MKKEPRSRARRLTAEFVVITVGVLVALWIDATWEWLQERDEEALILENLRADFDYNLSRLEEIVAIREALVRLNLRALEQGAAAVPADSLVEFMLAALPLETYNPRRGALQAALSSGRINLIRDPELRSRLAAWDGYLDDAQEEIEALDPRNYEVMEVVAEDMRLYALPFLAGQPLDTAGVRGTLQRVYSTPELRDFLTLKTITIAAMAPELEALHAATAEVVELLREE